MVRRPNPSDASKSIDLTGCAQKQTTKIHLSGCHFFLQFFTPPSSFQVAYNTERGDRYIAGTKDEPLVLNSCSVSRGIQEVEFTQPRAHFFLAHLSTFYGMAWPSHAFVDIVPHDSKRSAISLR